MFDILDFKVYQGYPDHSQGSLFSLSPLHRHREKTPVPMFRNGDLIPWQREVYNISSHTICPLAPHDRVMISYGELRI
jgi:hypothetical protein